MHLIEDAAHGLFASYQGVPLGRFGSLGTLSFHRTKNISCGEGGALIVNDEGLADRVEIALDKGTDRAAFERGDVSSYQWNGLGSAGRMPAPQVELLDTQLQRRDRIQHHRRHVWCAYFDGLAPWAERNGCQLPFIGPGVEHPAHRLFVLLPRKVQRDQLVAWCRAKGVEVARHYDSLPLTTFGRTVALPSDRCPRATEFAGRLVRLPMGGHLVDADVERVIDAVTTFPVH